MGPRAILMPSQIDMPPEPRGPKLGGGDVMENPHRWVMHGAGVGPTEAVSEFTLLVGAEGSTTPTAADVETVGNL